TGREHLVQARHLTELHLEGRGDGGGHDLWTGARIEGLHLDGRVIDLGQGRDWQEAVGDDADQHDGGHQQRGRDWPQDERPGWAHASGMWSGRMSWIIALATDAAAPAGPGPTGPATGPSYQGRLSGSAERSGPIARFDLAVRSGP